MQRSAHALIRLGDYAYNGWGTQPVPRLYSRRLLEHVVHLDDHDIIAEGLEDLLDTNGQSMEGWGTTRQMHDLYQRRSNHQYEEAYCKKE